MSGRTESWCRRSISCNRPDAAYPALSRFLYSRVVGPSEVKMNIRIFSASLYCAVVLCSAIPASAGVRPEITKHLRMAQGMAQRAFFIAQRQISEAEAVPNQTDEEKNAVAQVKARLSKAYYRDNYLTDAQQGAIDPSDSQVTVPAQTYSPPEPPPQP